MPITKVTPNELDLSSSLTTTINSLAVTTASANLVTANNATFVSLNTSTNSVVFGTAFYISGGNIGIADGAPIVKLSVNSTDAIKVPVGTTAQRPAGVNGYIRYNSNTASFEGYSSSGWGSIGGGARGGNTDQIFWENGITVTADYTISANTNAGSFGPITIANNVAVTVPNNSTWTIV